MTSLACVPEGRPIWSDVALGAAPLLAVAAPWTRNPMMIAPGQVPATSHSFVAARHMVPALPGACMQVLLVPSQVSVVQGSPSSVHAVPAGCLESLGHVVVAPVQVSCGSHSPALARRAVPALRAGGRPVVAGPVDGW